MSQMYRQIIIDRFKNPQYRGILENPDIAHGDENISCGDKLTFYIRIGPDQKVEEVSYEGRGCTISLASADILAEALEEMTLEEIQKLDNQFMLDLLGIQITPTRTKCAILGLHIVKAGANLYSEYGRKGAISALKEKNGT
ncbi:MAG: iron-sulfur cluster assembly scaffold protein [Candidatus Heimdallarchaeota archaeon]